MNNKRIIVTGGAGFIGSALIRYLIKHTNSDVINIDVLTHGSNLKAVQDVENNTRYRFLKADICNAQVMHETFKNFQPHAVMHLAAQSHVDRSITHTEEFIHSNIQGTYTLLEVARQYWGTMKNTENFRFLYVSTDEVYGSLTLEGSKFTEQTFYAPNSPYSASKAASDHLVRAWFKTYKLPTLTTHCSNNYGPWQYPEKLIPHIITRALSNQSLPIYGKGDNIRDWIYVDDHVQALYQVLQHGQVGNIYNIGGNHEVCNVDIVKKICTLLDQIQPKSNGKSYIEQITFVQDRPGHDFRYAIDNTKIKTELSWQPKVSFDEGLRKTVLWYCDHQGMNYLNNAI